MIRPGQGAGPEGLASRAPRSTDSTIAMLKQASERFTCANPCEWNLTVRRTGLHRTPSCVLGTTAGPSVHASGVEVCEHLAELLIVKDPLEDGLVLVHA